MGHNTDHAIERMLGSITTAAQKSRAAAGVSASSATPEHHSGVVEDVVMGMVDLFAAPAPGDVHTGLHGLIEKFRAAGHGPAVDSWVGTGTNQRLSSDQIADVLGGDLIERLMKQTGQSREEVLNDLADLLPSTIDRISPEGRLPPAKAV